MGRTGIYACGESVSRHNSSELVVLFSLKQEASASIGGGTFTALDNDIRLQIMGWLKEPEKHFPPQGIHLPEGVSFPGGVCVGSICDKAGISQSTVSHYLDILLQAGLLESQRAGKWTYYRRNEATIQAFSAYIRDDL